MDRDCSLLNMIVTLTVKKRNDLYTGTFAGLNVAIENFAGDMRHGKNWVQKMAHDYGYIVGTVGADGDELDCFCGPHQKDAENFYVVEQCNKDGSFDEHKIMLGFSNIAEARDGYLANYPHGWDGLKNISEFPMTGFWDWYYGSNRKNVKEECMPAYKFRSGNGLVERGADRYGSVENGTDCTDCGGGGKYAMSNCKTCGGSGKKNAKISKTEAEALFEEYAAEIENPADSDSTDEALQLNKIKQWLRGHKGLSSDDANYVGNIWMQMLSG